MKAKKFCIATLFLLVPFVMANSPAPQVEDAPYNDFTATFVSKTPNANDVEGLYEFRYSVTNTGAGYLSYVRAEKDGRSEAYIHLQSDKYYDIVLAPNKTMEMTFYSMVDFENSDGITFSGSGFTEFLENPFKNTDFVVELESSSENYHWYVVKADFDFTVNESGYRFGAIINATYKGEEVSIFNRHLNDNDEIYFSYEDEDALDLDQFVINNILIIKTEYHSPYTFLADAFQVMQIVAIVCIGVFMGGGLLFICIFFPIREARKRKRLKEQKGQ